MDARRADELFAGYRRYLGGHYAQRYGAVPVACRTGGFLDTIIDAGVAFRTSGCPGKERADISACDRPYGDSPPSDIASYPFQPGRQDLRKIRRQLKIPVVQG